MIITQTLDIRVHEDELVILSEVLDLLGKKRYEEAKERIILRRDVLMARPRLKDYGT